MRTGHITSVEALIRWQHPTRGLLPPADFLDVAEGRRLMVPIGDWVLRLATAQAARWQANYEYEPSEEEILETLLPRNITTQILAALYENQASFFGAQMGAMDNATRNAGDLINSLTLQYNRKRQAQITTELIEIIAGAEAL